MILRGGGRGLFCHCRNADEKLERTEPNVAGADGELRERVQQPGRLGRGADAATVAGVVRPAVRDDRQRETGQGGGPAVSELCLQISDI